MEPLGGLGSFNERIPLDLGTAFAGQESSKDVNQDIGLNLVGHLKFVRVSSLSSSSALTSLCPARSGQGLGHKLHPEITRQ